MENRKIAHHLYFFFFCISQHTKFFKIAPVFTNFHFRWEHTHSYRNAYFQFKNCLRETLKWSLVLDKLKIFNSLVEQHVSRFFNAKAIGQLILWTFLLIKLVQEVSVENHLNPEDIVLENNKQKLRLFCPHSEWIYNIRGPFKK